MYYILIIISERQNYQSLYKIYTEKDDSGVEKPWTTSDLELLENKYRELLVIYPEKSFKVVADVEATLNVVITGDLVPETPTEEELLDLYNQILTEINQ